ncbi:MAG: hypothetical protein EXR48_03400 [Dehalococcoidia bacterium]|nr:hypothetical protein [Dehalococcoidia bacterium]
MNSTLSKYLHDMGRKLRLDQQTRQEVLREVRTHLDDLVQELQQRGLSPEAAWREAVRILGKPEELANGLYAAHSRASLAQTGMATAPHLLFAFLFAMHLWAATSTLILFLIATVVISMLVWRKGLPDWGYPWVGYCLVAPAAAWLLVFSEVGQATFHLVSSGSPGIPVLLYLLGSVYVLVALVLAWRFLRIVVRRDWLFASLMVFPFPVLTSWLVYLNKNGGALSYDSGRASLIDGATALVFLGLALTTAVVYRVGQRFTKVALLSVALPLMTVLAATTHLGSVWSVGVFLLLLFSLAIVAVPAYLQNQVADGDSTTVQP